MSYPSELVEPIRRELNKLGARELRLPEEVDALLDGANGTVLVFVNSVCGCAAGVARPGLARALEHSVTPDVVATVFAGVDIEATSRLRTRIGDHPPSSPQIALFKDGRLLHLTQRHEIEGRIAEEIALSLTQIFDRYCR